MSKALTISLAGALLLLGGTWFGVSNASAQADCCSDIVNARCNPEGVCTACKNCKSCKNCSEGGTCSVCRKE